MLTCTLYALSALARNSEEEKKRQGERQREHAAFVQTQYAELTYANSKGGGV